MIDWTTLIAERNAWVSHNFPVPTIRNPGESLLGCIEELGELTHAVLKLGQDIRGPAAKHEEQMIDSIGDLSVYLMGVMSWANYEPNPKLGIDPVHGSLHRMAYDVGVMNRYYLIEQEALYYQAPIDNLVKGMMLFCDGRGWGYQEILETTWKQVSQRDWIKYPTDGRTS